MGCLCYNLKNCFTCLYNMDYLYNLFQKRNSSAQEVFPKYCSFTEQEVEGIILACKHGNLADLKKRYSDSGNFSHIYQNETGLNPLMVACKANQAEVVWWLLTGEDGQPLNGIDLRYQVKIVPRKIEILGSFAGHRTDKYDVAEKSTVFHIAAQYSNRETVDILFKTSASAMHDCLEMINGDYYTPLEAAISNGSGEAIYRLHQAQVRNLESKHYTNFLSIIELRRIGISDSRTIENEKKILNNYFQAYQLNKRRSESIINKLRKLDEDMPRSLDLGTPNKKFTYTGIS